MKGNGPFVYGIALNADERELLERAVRELVEREGATPTTVSVLGMIKRPAAIMELGALDDGDRLH